MARPPWCPEHGKAGDHRLGEASWPGSRTYGHLESNEVHEHPVLAGQQICVGDIVTLDRGCIARVESAAGSGDGMNWGDVSRGAYMALAPADTTSPQGRHGTVSVYAYGARIESILDADATVGSYMGIDLRAVEGAERVDRTGPVTRSTDRNLDRALWQRTRVMSEDDMRHETRKKAFLGRLVKILASDDPRATRAAQGDYGAIDLLHRDYA